MRKNKALATLFFAVALMIGFLNCKIESKPSNPTDDTPVVPTDDTPTVQTANTYTVIFDTDGGGEIAAQEIEEGKLASKPNDPVKTGYIFAGWYNGETAFDFSTPITADTSLKARWNIIKSSVTVSDSITAGLLIIDKTENVSYGDTVTVTATGTEAVKTMTVKDSKGNTVPVTGNTFLMPDSDVTVLSVEFWIGTKPADAPKAVCDIVFTDGSATPTDVFKDFDDDVKVAKKGSAVAVIFYTPTDNNNSTLGARTIGIGLLTTKAKWCSSDAIGYGKLELDPYNGFENLKIIKALEDWQTDAATKYPAFYWLDNYGVSVGGDSTGWYMPTPPEYNALYSHFREVEKAIALLEKNIPISSGYYWMSIQLKADDSVYCFCQGLFGVEKKDTEHSKDDVCAFREF